MRKLFFIIFSFITIYTSATNPIKIGVITDVHYLSTSLMDKGYAMSNYVYASGKNTIEVPEVLDKVLNEYLASDIEVLLVCGDLTKDGEKQSHIDFQSKLKPLSDKGVKIFVIPGNHDINMPNATKYQGNKTYKTENITPKEFENIYAKYGYANSINRDIHSLSYVAELDATTWLLAIDAARYDEYKNSPITAGRIKGETEEWIKQTLKMAKTQGKQVVAMMHWGVAEHLPLQATVFKDYLVNDHKRIANLLADNEVNIVFTGHFHSNDITKFTSENGNSIYDIETGALVSYPFAYRYINLYKESITIETKNITSIPSNANLWQENKELMKKVAKERALPMLKSKGFNFPQEQLDKIAEISGEIFVIHLYGDEKIDDSIKERLIDVFKEMGFPIDDNMNNLELDFPPADNNLTIKFD